MDLKIKRVGNHDLPLPAYAKPGDAGLDLRARIDDATVGRYKWEGITGSGFCLELEPNSRVVIPCGFALEIPAGHVGLIQDRSSMASRGLKVAGGVIDSGYRGEVSVVLINSNHTTATIKGGDKIAQMLILACPQATAIEVAELSDSERGANGFGSTGAR